MDRCRCPEYAAAVKNLKFYIVGTYRPDIIENYDRSQYTTVWVKKGIDHFDTRFAKPKAWRVKPEQDLPPTEGKLVEKMWCPYMTPYKLKLND